MANTQTLSADGSVTFDISAGGDRVLGAEGTFGSGTLTWYYSAAGSTFVAISGGAFTASGQVVVTCGSGCTLKATLAGATSPSIIVSVAGA